MHLPSIVTFAMNLNDTVTVVAVAAGIDGGQIDFDAALNYFDAAHNECGCLMTTVDTVAAAAADDDDDDQIDFDAGWSFAARHRSYLNY